jgi:hypothetical protein
MSLGQINQRFLKSRGFGVFCRAVLPVRLKQTPGRVLKTVVF